MRKTTNAERQYDKLPKRTEAGVIRGFIPDDYQIGHPFYEYKKCCQDPDNWQGVGEWQSLEVRETHLSLGYKLLCRDVSCKCGVPAIAHEFKTVAPETVNSEPDAKRIEA